MKTKFPRASPLTAGQQFDCIPRSHGINGYSWFSSVKYSQIILRHNATGGDYRTTGIIYIRLVLSGRRQPLLPIKNLPFMIPFKSLFIHMEFGTNSEQIEQLGTVTLPHLTIPRIPTHIQLINPDSQMVSDHFAFRGP